MYSAACLRNTNLKIIVSHEKMKDIFTFDWKIQSFPD